jgi:hypothetical protein
MQNQCNEGLSCNCGVWGIEIRDKSSKMRMSDTWDSLESYVT